MPLGYHPDLSNGAAIGILVSVAMIPAVGDPFVETQGVDEDGQPITLQTPNPDYVPARDITLEGARDALNATPYADDVRDVFYSGASSEELAEGKQRIVCQIVVNDPSESARRNAIDAAIESMG